MEANTLTSQATIKREVEKLKEETGAKEPRYIYFTFWHGLAVDESSLDVVKRDGEWLTIRVKCVDD